MRSGNWLARLSRNRVGAVAGPWLVAGALVSSGASRIAPYDPLKTSALELQAPSSDHLLATDYLGRDVLSRVIWGIRLSRLAAAGRQPLVARNAMHYPRRQPAATGTPAAATGPDDAPATAPAGERDRGVHVTEEPADLIDGLLGKETMST